MRTDSKAGASLRNLLFKKLKKEFLYWSNNKIWEIKNPEITKKISTPIKPDGR